MPRRGAGDQQGEPPSGQRRRQRSRRGQPRRQRDRVDSRHQQLLGLAVHRVLAVAPAIGVRMRAMPRRPRPFGRPARPQQPEIEIRPVGGLKIVDPVEAFAAQHMAQSQPARDIEPAWPAIDQNIFEQPGLRRQGGITCGGQQADPITGVVLANCRHRAERLDEVAESAELDDQNTPPARYGRRGFGLRPQSGQRVEVDMPG